MTRKRCSMSAASLAYVLERKASGSEYLQYSNSKDCRNSDPFAQRHLELPDDELRNNENQDIRDRVDGTSSNVECVHVNA